MVKVLTLYINQLVETLKEIVLLWGGGGIDEQWQMDLADMQSLKDHNDGYRYLLVCIDVFSKYAWIVSIKSKTGPALVEAFKVILSSGRKPHKIMTDQETEFFNKSFQTLLKNEGIEVFNTFNKTMPPLSRE